MVSQLISYLQLINTDEYGAPTNAAPSIVNYSINQEPIFRDPDKFVSAIGPSWEFGTRYNPWTSNEDGNHSIKIESDETFTATDLICEGPIEGLVDKNGSKLKFIDLPKSKLDVALAKGLYFNDVPVIDTYSNKFNFISSGFDIVYGYQNNQTTEYPSTVFRYAQRIYLNNSAVFSPSANTNYYSYFDGVYYSKGALTDVYIMSGGSTVRTNDTNIRNLAETSKASATPIIHRIKNKYCDLLNVRFSIDQLYSTDRSGNTKPFPARVFIEIGEDSSSDKCYIMAQLFGVSKAPALVDIPVYLNLSSKENGNYYVSIYAGQQNPPVTSGDKVISISLNSIVESVTTRGEFSYPYSTLVRTAVSSKHFQNDPNRTFDLKLLKIRTPNNYDSEAKEYAGNWSGQFDKFLRWTDNPAWVFYDICTNTRYGMGKNFISTTDLNKWDLYKVGKYCDELVKSDQTQFYESDAFARDPSRPNCIYISKQVFSEETGEFYERSLTDIKEQYPPATDFSKNYSNGGAGNSIIFLYDLIDSSTEEKIYQNFKKIIWNIIEVKRDGDSWVRAAEGDGEAFQLYLINDFSARKVYEEEPTGDLIKSFKQRVGAYLGTEDLKLADAVRYGAMNNELYAKSYALNFLTNNASSVRRPYRSKMIDTRIFDDDLNGKVFSGKCIARKINYADFLEPRFRINLLIDNETESLKLLNDIASTFRGILYSKNNLITATVDVNKEISYFFNNANVKDGLFSYSSASLDGNYTVAKILYKDEKDNFNDSVEIVEDSALIREYGIIIKEILGFGLTSRSQARRVGQWLLLTNKLENQSITFSTDLQGLLLKPSDIIEVQDDYRNDLFLQGRVLETNYDAPYVVVDRKLSLDLRGSKIKFLCEGRGSDDFTSVDFSESKFVEEFIIERIENNTGRVYLVINGDPSEEINIKFSKIVSSTPFLIEKKSTTLSKSLYKIINIIEQDANEYQIFCIKHDPKKYIDLDDSVYEDLSKEEDKTISFSFSQSVKELDLVNLFEDNSYYSVQTFNFSSLSSLGFDYSFNEEENPLFQTEDDGYALVQLYFSKIYSSIVGASDGGDEYYKKVYQLLKAGGGFLCKLTYKNQSINIKIPASSVSDKSIFLGRISTSSSNTISSVSAIKIYIYNNKNQIVEV